jgi:hypothetical protein
MYVVYFSGWMEPQTDTSTVILTIDSLQESITDKVKDTLGMNKNE